MKKPVAFLISSVLAAALALTFGPAPAFAETGVAATADPAIESVDLDAADDFTFETWSDSVDPATADGDEVSDAAARVKEMVLEAYDECAGSVAFEYGSATVADVRAGMALVYADAEHYWAASRYSMSYYDADGDKVADDTEVAAKLTLFYVVDTADIDTVKANTEAKVAEALSWVDADNMSDFEVAQALHDYLVRNCVYDKSSAGSKVPLQAHTAYGALVNGKAVCQGYALAYKLLLGRAGVPAVFVAAIESMNHAWNMVQIAGAWYHVDVTWDDPVYSDGTDAGFDADVSHTYFLRSDATMRDSLRHYGWEAAYTTPADDYANREYAEYKAAIPHVYDHSETATSNGVTFKVEWDDADTAGKATTFHVTQTGGSSDAKVRMDVPQYWDNGTQESVCDPSRAAWGSYATVGDGYDYSFEFTASGTYRCLFYFMDTTNGIYYLRTAANVTVSDAARPSVSAIVSDAVAQAKKATDGPEYAMALWLHDWTLDQLEYDHDLNWCSAESGLTRGKGTCESYQRIYAKLLTAAGIENGRVTGNGHTWNAVKIDGKWCQMDLTWDDSSDSWYGDFDQRHIYFGLTDELMAIAHSDHAANYQASGYAYRSCDPSNNYFVRNGKADEWADGYAARIQQHLDARDTSFSIDADNASFPPGICGIQNGIVAAVLTGREWAAADGAKVTLAATSNVVTESNTKWTASFGFTASYAAIDASGARVTAADQMWTGKALTPAPTVTLGGKTLKQGTDYTVTYSNNVNAGTATVTVTFKGNYSGTATGTFRIVEASQESIAGASVTAKAQVYAGSALAPEPTVTLGGTKLTKGTDYKVVSYEDNVNAGTAKVTIEGVGNYTGTVSGTFQIAAADASGAKVTADGKTYTGSALTPEPTVSLGEKTLVKGTDYDVAGYENNTNAGTATVKVAFKGNYSGAATGTFQIAKASVSSASVSVASQTYAGSALTPAVTVKVGDRTLAKGKDYTVAYSGNVNAGTAKVTVTGAGNYQGSKTTTFTIAAADASGAKVAAAAQAWTGKAIETPVTVTLGGKTLKQGSDYTVSYANNVNAGTATATVTFKGNYRGTAKGTFQINAMDASRAQVKVSDQAWTGKALTPAPTVTLGGKTLKQGADYTVAYANNVNAGTATVTVAFKGNYSGKATGTFRIAKKDSGQAAARITMTRLYNPWSGEHLYTSSAAEIKKCVSLGWNNEGTAWVAPSTSSTPVYRLYNPYSGDHHYTTSAKEYEACARQGWRQEGVGWYSDDARGVPLYRGYNRYVTVGTHHYTMSRSELGTMVENGWKDEGVAWYGLK